MNVQTIEGVTIAHVIPESKGRKMTPVYLFAVDNMLVDTGPSNMYKTLRPFFDAQSYDFIALTHNHEDHSGNVAELANQRELPVYVHEIGLEECFLETPYPYYRQLAWGERKPFQPSKMPDQLTTSNATWDVIFTPGHAKDHISLLDEQTGRLFTGDLFVTPKPKVIMEAESIPETLRSLKKLLNYEFTSIFCCHSGYHKNGKDMINLKIEHLEALIAQVHELTDRGHSIDEIDKLLYPKTYPIETVSEGQWSSRHIVSSIVEEQ